MPNQPSESRRDASHRNAPPAGLKPTSNAYLRTKVLTASPEELRLMLFDGALRFARLAREGLSAGDFDRSYEGVTRCQAILLELINTLRPEHDPDLCRNLSSLYTFLYTRLIDAGAERDATIVDEVIGLLEYERETWAMLVAKLTEANREASTIAALPASPNAGKPANPNSRPGDGVIGGNLSCEG